MPACERVPAAAARLVSFRQACCALAPAPAGKERRRSLGRREIYLRGGFANACNGRRCAGDSPSPKSEWPCHAEAVPHRRIGGRSAVLAPRRRTVQARFAQRLGLLIVAPRSTAASCGRPVLLASPCFSLWRKRAHAAE